MTEPRTCESCGRVAKVGEDIWGAAIFRYEAGLRQWKGELCHKCVGDIIDHLLGIGGTRQSVVVQDERYQNEEDVVDYD